MTNKKDKTITKKSTINNKKSKKKNNISSKDIEDKKVVKKCEINKNKIFKFILLVILIIIFLYSVISLILNQIDYYRNKRDSENLIDEVVLPNDSIDNIGEPSILEEEIPKEERPNINPETVKIDFNKLLKTNGDIKAWMMFNRMYINNPVVQSSDNDYYLSRNFYRNKSEIGTLFFDHRNKSFDDKNLVIFGHSTIDKSMFGSLSDVFKSGFFNRENADIIYFYDTNNNLIKYQIFSYYTIEKEEYYIKTNFKNNNDFQEWINTIVSRSLTNRGISVTTNDKILTLSTCAGSRGTSNRRVIHAKRIQ